MNGPDFEFDELDELNLSSSLNFDNEYEEELGATPTSTKQYDAAIKLRDYLLKTNSFGTKNAPDETVHFCQRDMGGIADDGIVGPKTEARAKALGVTLPKRKVTSNNVKVSNTSKEAANNLKDYLEKTNSFGSKAKPDKNIKTYQSKMGGLTADGIVGPKTEARSKALGIILPKPKSASVAAPKITVVNKPSEKPSPEKSAAGLKSYLERTKDFGSKNKPSATVRTYQTLMGSITADGIVGPKTEARAKSLGSILPKNPATILLTAISLSKQPVNKTNIKKPITKPSATTKTVTKPDNKQINTVAPKEGAVALSKYLSRTNSFGSKSSPDKTVKVYQKIMTGLTVDGIVGPKTVSRAKALGVTLPKKIVDNVIRVETTDIRTETTDTPDFVNKIITDEPKFIEEKTVNFVNNKYDEAAKAKMKLAIIGRLGDAYPNFKIWDTMAFRKKVLDLLRIAAGQV